jgi:L-rhamnose mutarotase
MKRFGMVIKVKPEGLDEYKRLHANPWPQVNQILHDQGIRNFSIFEKDHLLFGYFEFGGADVNVAFKAMEDYPIYREWLALCDPLQEPLPTRTAGEWWSFMEQVYHLDIPDIPQK